MYKFLLPYDKVVKKYMYYLRAVNLFKGILILVGPFSTKILFDYLIDKQRTEYVVLWCVTFIATTMIINGFIFYFVDYIGDKAATIISNQLRKKLMKKLLDIPVYEYNKLDKSMLFNIIINETTIATVAFLNDKVTFVSCFIQFLVYCAIIFVIQWKIGIIVLVAAPIFFFLSLRNQQGFYESANKERLEADKLVKNFETIADSKKQAYLFDKNSLFINIFNKSVDSWGKARIRYNLFYTFFNQIPLALNELTIIFIMAIGAIYVINGSITIGSLILVSQVISYIFQQLSDMVSAKIQVASTKATFDRINDFFFIEEVENEFLTNNKPQDKILLENIDIQIENQKLYYIDELRLEENGLYLIEGENGSGKSTLLNIITGVLNHKLEEGVKIAVPALEDIGYFCAPNFFLNDTALANITLDKEIEEKELRTLGTLLEIDFMDEVIDTSSINLSMGQQQKLSLARFIFHSKDKKLWLLDEPFTNLDIKVIDRLLKYFKEMSMEKIMIVVSHDKYLEDIATKKYEIASNYLHEIKSLQII